MPLNFPSSPTVGQVFGDYIWDGEKWALNPPTGGGGGGDPPSDALPLMNGTASAGVVDEYSRGDHIHPSDTSKASISYVDASVGNKVSKSGDTMTGSLSVAGTVISNTAFQYGASINEFGSAIAIRRNNAVGMEFGHNAANYGSSIGSDSNGTPYLALFGKGGTGTSFTTGSGFAASIMMPDGVGGFTFGKVNASQTNAAQTLTYIIDPSGNTIASGHVRANATSGFYLGASHLALLISGNHHGLFAPDGGFGIYLGNSAVGSANSYYADTHTFFNRASSVNFATINPTGLSVNATSNTGIKIDGTVVGVFNNGGNIGLVIGTVSNHDVDTYANNALKIRLYASGRTTFFDTTPASAYNAASVVLAGGLGVAGGIISNGAIIAPSGSGFRLGTGGSSYLALYNSSNYTYLGAPTGSGGVLVGNTTDPVNYYDNTEHRLRSAGGGTTWVTINGGGLALDGSAAVLIMNASVDATPVISMRENGTQKWQIYSYHGNDYLYVLDGDGSHGVYIAQNTNAWASVSDARAKSAIRPVSVRERMTRFGAFGNFDWLSSGKTDLGVTAQEFYKAFPEWTIKGDDEDRVVGGISDAGAWGILDTKTGLAALAYCREIDEDVEDLKRQIAALKAQLH